MSEIDKAAIAALLEKQRAKAEANKRQRSFLLLPHRDMIAAMMEENVSLPFMLEWLDGKGVKVALTTLRGFIVREFGEDVYGEYCRRNGWQRTKKSKGSLTEKPAREPAAPVLTSGKGKTGGEGPPERVEGNEGFQHGQGRRPVILKQDKGVYGDLRPSSVDGFVDVKKGESEK